MSDRIREKLTILADAAKYDVSCSSSGSKRKNHTKGLGDASNGICHTYTEDGRCVSLLKILLTNHCIYDCAFCVSRKSNDVRRAAFTVEEVVDLDDQALAQCAKVSREGDIGAVRHLLDLGERGRFQVVERRHGGVVRGHGIDEKPALRDVCACDWPV